MRRRFERVGDLTSLREGAGVDRANDLAAAVGGVDAAGEKLVEGDAVDGGCHDVVCGLVQDSAKRERERLCASLMVFGSRLSLGLLPENFWRHSPLPSRFVTALLRFLA